MPDPRPTPEGRILRCFCSRTPVLAIYGVDKSGEPFLHIKSWKQHRVFVEAVFRGSGTVRIYCRECIRWHAITLGRNIQLKMVEAEKPVELEAGVPNSPQV